ncbi:MAG: MBL fold metallo-hydrolase [Pseudonocardiaceae bacterium]
MSALKAEITRCGAAGVPSLDSMSITELRPHLYRLVLGRYQAFLWHEDDSVTFIDTGEAGSGPAIDAGLRQIGLATSDLDRLVLTHFHVDRAEAAASFCRLAELDVETACFGHGEPLIDNAATRLQQVASALASDASSD